MAEQPKILQQSASDKFHSHFQNEVVNLQREIDNLAGLGTSGGERADAIDHCLSRIARLSNEVNDASSFTPAHDQRVYATTIKDLKQKLQNVKNSVAPRPKFAFKSGLSFPTKKNESAISLNDAAELAGRKPKRFPADTSDLSNPSTADDSPAGVNTPAEVSSEGDHAYTGDSLPDESSRIRQPSFSQSSSVNISRHENTHIILPAAAGHATSSGIISNIRRSVIDMSKPTFTGKRFAGLTLKNVTSSLIICGHVDGSAFLTHIRDSVIVVLSRQFRMHESSNCVVYLSTSSAPIIEDCTTIRFALAPEQYMSAEDKMLSRENTWSKVEDFKWLKSEPSPNWSLLEHAKRVPEEVWNNIVPGGPTLGPEDILSAVGVTR